MSKPKRTLEDGKTRYITTGGAGYIPDASPAISDIITKVVNLGKYAGRYLSSKLLGTGDGTFIDLSDENVSRIKSNTKGVKTVLANDFLEKKSNTIRKKRDFVNTTDTLLGDKKIPLSKISTYYGIENGKLKAGPLSIFNDTTTVVPNRTKKVSKLKKIIAVNENSFTNEADKIIDEYNKERGYKQPAWANIINSVLPFTKPMNPRGILLYNEGSQAIRTLLNNTNLGITESGDTINLPNINATPKVMFADEEGHSSFVSNLYNENNIKKLNEYLRKHPSYPVMVDNGRYNTYMDFNPNIEEYAGLANPNDMFIIGTREKQRDGGSIHIAPSKRGTFSAAARKHGMGVQQFANTVLKNKDRYSPAMVKKANFARNASKWNH